MTQTYFLGANTPGGFYSLYDGFPGSADCFRHIIKGGPGTGKSGFMRRIGQAAQARGLEVHYVLCSGDPASLDGVYLPALRQAWVDGTAPHTAEPRCFGVDSDYVNLGSFCRTPFSEGDRQAALDLSRRYRACYAEAYRALAAVSPPAEKPGALSDAEAALRDLSGEPRAIDGAAQRFLHAVTCQGELVLEDEAKKLCKQVRVLPAAALLPLSRELERRRLPAIRCPSPLDPPRLEALLLPWANRAFLAERETLPLSEAIDALRRAKALHDELEAVSLRYMDFAALTAFTEESVKQLFG